MNSNLTRQPALRAAYRRLRSAYWRFGDFCRFLGRDARDPNDPWRGYTFIDPRAHAGRLTHGAHYRPLTLQCETVNICNNLCMICAYPLHLRKKVVMSMEVFEKVLRDYSAMGGGYLSLTPVTGDILLDKHLLERLALVKRYPAIREIGVTTNAAMLDRFSDDAVRTIVESFGKLQLSVYGLDEDEYAAMTKRRTYRRAVDGMRRILEVKVKGVYLSFRLLKPRSERQIREWIANVLGCKKEVAVNSIMTGGYANFSALDTSEPLPYGASWRDPALRTRKTQCAIPLLAVQVSSNGDVSFCPCIGARDDLVIGNINQDPLLALYNSPKTRALWDWANEGIPPSCAQCSFHMPIDVFRSDRSIIEDPFKLTGA